MVVKNASVAYPPHASEDSMNRVLSRRQLLRMMSTAAIGAPVVGRFGASKVAAQGRCMLTLGSPACNTTAIPPVFEPTGWKTTALDHLVFRVADYQKEAAFYIALMGWTLRSDDGASAVLDIGDWGSVVFKNAERSTDGETSNGRRATV